MIKGLVVVVDEGRDLALDVPLVQPSARSSRHNRPIAGRLQKRAVGSTLLPKGLEAEVAVILNPIPMDAKHLYVAMTRASHRLVFCSPRNRLSGAGCFEAPFATERVRQG